MDNTDEIFWTISIGMLLASNLLNTSRVLHAIDVCRECLILLNNKGLAKEKKLVESANGAIHLLLFEGYCFLSDHTRGIECGRKLLDFLRGLGLRAKEGEVTSQMGKLYEFQSKYKEAKRLHKKALTIMIEIGDKKGEARCYGNLGIVSQCVDEYEKAEEYQRKALAITKEIGNKKEEAACYLNLGTVYYSLSEYAKAEEYQRKALAIKKEIGDKEGEAACYGNLGSVSRRLGEYGKAEEYQKRALAIRKEIGDNEGEAACYGNLGRVSRCLGEYGEAEEYQRKALEIRKEIGDKKGEATCYANLGTVYFSVSEYTKAEEYLKNALAMTENIGDKRGEAACYENLGRVSEYLDEYGKAEEYQRNALEIRKKIGDKQGESSCYLNLGSVYLSLSEYVKAEEHQKKALAIKKEIGDREGEAMCYLSLGCVSESLGEYGKAEEYEREALAITKDIGDKQGESESYLNLGNVYISSGEYAKAEEHQKKALAIKKEIGDRQGEATCYLNLGNVSLCCGDYGKAEEYLREALAIKKEIGDKKGEAACHGHLGTLFRSLGKHPEARKYHEKALAMSKEISNICAEAEWHFQLACDAMADKNVGFQHQLFSNLFASIGKCEKIRKFLGRNDQFKISLLEKRRHPYHLLSTLLCASGNEKEAVCALELGRARALADLISGQHSAQQQISVNPPSWADIERIVKKEYKSSCLYISYFHHHMFLWVFKGSKLIHFRKIDVNECFVNKGLERNVDQVFSEECFRRFIVLPQEHCEDRSLSFLKASDSTRETAEEESLKVYRPVEEEEEENLEPASTLSERYRMIIAPVADCLDQHELLIVPDRALYKVPFAALTDESGKYLSQTYRIRIVPSLTTLGLIRDTPADYHSRTGALIVGDPDVRDVYYKGCFGVLSKLPSAREEAEMIGRLIRAEPLLGKQATKEAVLRSIHSVSLIHFAAHGDAERGEIALAPQHPMNGPATEKDYLLTMADISKVQLRAKLVVLSCCHSAQGQVRSEGVVGIARAFLGSGARSVLVALWAIPDEATKKLMTRFYEHLVRGESASESLYQAMEWMRNNGYSDVRDWAPFMLIGDNVTFDFGK